ncbi:MAG: sugar ABC transporter permease [Planctomycetota bacterium]
MSTPNAIKRELTGIAWISPWLFGFLAFMVLPIGMSIYYSLTDYPVIEAPLFVGLDNFAELMRDEIFWLSVRNTVIYAVVSVPITTALSIGLAALVNQKLPGVGFFKAAIFVPTLVPLVASAMIWMWLFNGELGLINRGVMLIGLDHVLGFFVGESSYVPAWLTSASWVMVALVLMICWSVGHPMVIYLAAMQDVPRSLYEAAEIDGAGPVRRLWNVTLPGISPVILFNVITATIGAWQIFAVPYIMFGDGGGPGRAAYFYTWYLYDNAFRFQRMGYASALAWVQFLIILFFTAIIMLASRRLVHYRAT